jgi:NAD-dependent SIR2 family protein deacetylase
MPDKVKWLDKYCNSCGGQLNSWDARISKSLAYKNPVCEKCIAKEYDIEIDELRDKMENFFGMRPCQGI